MAAVCMQEYTGIDAGRLELMETRLAADVRREAAQHGRVLVAREQLSTSGHAASTITDAYEPVACMFSYVPCPSHFTGRPLTFLPSFPRFVSACISFFLPFFLPSLLPFSLPLSLPLPPYSLPFQIPFLTAHSHSHHG